MLEIIYKGIDKIKHDEQTVAIKQLYYVKPNTEKQTNKIPDDLEYLEKDLGVDVTRLNIVAIKVCKTLIGSDLKYLVSIQNLSEEFHQGLERIQN